MDRNPVLATGFETLLTCGGLHEAGRSTERGPVQRQGGQTRALRVIWPVPGDEIARREHDAASKEEGLLIDDRRALT